MKFDFELLENLIVGGVFIVLPIVTVVVFIINLIQRFFVL